MRAGAAKGTRFFATLRMTGRADWEADCEAGRWAFSGTGGGETGLIQWEWAEVRAVGSGSC